VTTATIDCRACLRVLPRSEFRTIKERSCKERRASGEIKLYVYPDRRGCDVWCRECRRAYARRWDKATRRKRKAEEAGA